MTLAEAIRLGAMLRPQGRGGYDDGESACALRSAAMAVGLVDLTNPTTFLNYVALRQRFPILNARVHAPVFGGQILLDAIWRLNDIARWSREAIADWVEQVERAHTPTEQTVTVTVPV